MVSSNSNKDLYTMNQEKNKYKIMTVLKGKYK